jgi:transcriptional regulator with XRE-family HTH domain
MFHERLNAVRKSKGYTAQYMSDALCISIRSYRLYESADRMPNLNMLCKIADILNVSTDYLLCRDNFLKSHGVHVDELP